MDKVKKYLELYVEWLALAIGGAFLLWMVYLYVVSKPVAVVVGSNSAVTPGEIDQLIWDEKGKKLQDQVSSTALPPNLPKVADMVAQVRNRLEVSDQYAMAGPYTPLTLDASGGVDDGAVIPQQQGTQVTDLPKPPAILDLKVSGGHSNVPAPVPPGQVAAAGGAPTLPVSAVDKSWRTISGRIPIAALVKAFDAQKIPDKLYSTAVLRVELIRQERDAAGNWGPDQGIAVPPLSINPMNPLPAVDAPVNEQRDFQDWAEKNSPLIMEPPFYQVLQGDIWYLPGTKNPNEVQVQIVAFDPTTFKGDPGSLSPDDRKVWDAYKLKLRQDAAAARRAALQNRNGLPPQNPGLGDPNYVPPINGRRSGSGEGSSGAPGAYAPNGGFAPPVPGADPMNAGPTPDQMPGVADTAAATAAAATVPQGSFDPRKQVDIVVWAHDDTVQAGKTYRYMLRYEISNPVARSVGLCNPQTLANQFYIVSLDSAWTDPVSVESDTNFYAVKVNPSRNEVSFDVFHWKDGLWQLQTVKVTPGDMVGGIDPTDNKTDFTTGWTLVDVRTDPRDETVTIVLASDNGTVLRKDPNTDMRNAEYHKLLELVREQQAKDAAKTAAAQ